MKKKQMKKQKKKTQKKSVCKGRPLKNTGFQKKNGGSPHFKKIQNNISTQITSVNKTSRTSPSKSIKWKTDSHKNQSKVKNLVKNSIKNKNKDKDPINDIQKKKITVCKNEYGVVVLKKPWWVKFLTL